jgi:PleD family two-component response regulator
MKTRGGMLSATQVARFCAVDLKTIHNWVNRAKVPAARTAGRHLRFRPLDVAEFLRTYGYDVPDGLRQMKLRVLVVDADVAALAEAKRLLARRFDVMVAGHVVDGLLAVATLLPDVLVAGDVSPVDMTTIARRLAAIETTRHVRVVPRGEVASLRERLERLAG